MSQPLAPASSASAIRLCPSHDRHEARVSSSAVPPCPVHEELRGRSCERQERLFYVGAIPEIAQLSWNYGSEKVETLDQRVLATILCHLMEFWYWPWDAYSGAHLY